MVDVLRPRKLDDALSWLKEKKALPLAGGTDLMVHYRGYSGTGSRIDRPVLFTDAIEELRQIEVLDDSLRIGAAALLSEIENHEEVPEVLRLAVSEIAAPALRNRATMAGNICNGSPAGDSLPPLYIFNARVVLAGPKGTRTLPVEDFITGPGQTVLADDELMTHIEMPKVKEGIFYYRKVGTRAANALSKLSVAAMAEIEKGKIKDFRIAFGAVAPTVVRKLEIEEQVIGTAVEQLDVSAIRGKYDSFIRPIDDQRSTARYRKEVALNLLGEFISKIQESV